MWSLYSIGLGQSLRLSRACFGNVSTMASKEEQVCDLITFIIWLRTVKPAASVVDEPPWALVCVFGIAPGSMGTVPRGAGMLVGTGCMSQFARILVEFMVACVWNMIGSIGRMSKAD
jgi:hypothetical protein